MQGVYVGVVRMWKADVLGVVGGMMRKMINRVGAKVPRMSWPDERGDIDNRRMSGADHPAR